MSSKKENTAEMPKLSPNGLAGKIQAIFKKIGKYCIITVILLIVALVLSISESSNLYNKAYEADHEAQKLRMNVQKLSKNYLWVLSADGKDERDEHLAETEDNIESLQSELKKLGKVYTDKTKLSQLSSDIDTVVANGETLETKLDEYSKAVVNAAFASTDVNDKYSESLSFFNDTLYPSIEAVDDDLKDIGDDLDSYWLMNYKVSTAVCIALALAAVVLIALTLRVMRKSRNDLATAIMKPVSAIMKGSDDMAAGSLNINIDYHENDELGRLAGDLSKSTSMISDIVKDVIETLERFSNRDFSHGTDRPELYIGDYVTIRESFDRIADNLSETLGNVQQSSEAVAEGASNMSKGANDLASGSQDQAAAVEELTASINTVTEQTRQMADSSEQSVEMSGEVKDKAAQSADKMNEVTEAMTRITEASKKIEQITNNIEAIARQTSLLALNASIEAARAGEAGRGFAVVADEISQLANQSTDAAKSTHQLINDALAEIDNGNKVVGETTAALTDMQESVNNVADVMKKSGDLANEQVAHMEEIEKGIEQISNVVQNNSATAEESSAVSQELTDQSAELSKLIEAFKIKVA